MKNYHKHSREEDVSSSKSTHEILALKNAAFFIDEMNANPEPSHAFTRKDAFPLYSWLSAYAGKSVPISFPLLYFSLSFSILHPAESIIANRYSPSNSNATILFQASRPPTRPSTPHLCGRWACY
jgi:hypothetical protein